MLEHLKAHLQEGSCVILGIGNILRSDDGAGSLLARRIEGRVRHKVYDCGTSPENYLGKIINDNPQTVVLIDAVDFSGRAGEFKEIEAGEVQTQNLFFTHNASLTLVISYLKSRIKAEIIVLAIQPKRLKFDDELSPEVSGALHRLEEWFNEGYRFKG